jgi:diadenosine tetraphosphate (Ap4A) HIT family hydrolase
MRVKGCIYCETAGGRTIWMDRRCRIVLADEPGFPGLCRVVWNDHTKEMTDLDHADRAHVMDAVFATEQALRDLLRPEKMNVATLGNLVPHLHWHVIPRYADDSHFPRPIWSEPLRPGAARPLPPDFVPQLTAALEARLGKQ